MSLSNGPADDTNGRHGVRAGLLQVHAQQGTYGGCSVQDSLSSPVPCIQHDILAPVSCVDSLLDAFRKVKACVFLHTEVLHMYIVSVKMSVF